MRRTNYILAFLLSSAFLSSSALLAQESKAGHSHAKAEIHGGEAAMTKAHHFEVVWMPDHVMVYLYDMNQKPLSAKGVSGEVVFKFKDGKEQKATLTLMEAGKMMEEHPSEKHAEHPAEKTEHPSEKKAEHPAEKAGHPAEKHDMAHGKMSEKEMTEMHKLMSNQDHLMAKVNLENVKEGEVKATFTLKGLPDKNESEATFASKYKMMSMMHHESGKQEQHH
ncbi:MAG: hypothetical protein ACRENG_24155 [bacterium]